LVVCEKNKSRGIAKICLVICGKELLVVYGRRGDD
jgi:hypothetical protein